MLVCRNGKVRMWYKEMTFGVQHVCMHQGLTHGWSTVMWAVRLSATLFGTTVLCRCRYVGRCVLVDLPDLAVSSTYHPWPMPQVIQHWEKLTMQPMIDLLLWAQPCLQIRDGICCLCICRHSVWSAEADWSCIVRWSCGSQTWEVKGLVSLETNLWERCSMCVSLGEKCRMIEKWWNVECIPLRSGGFPGSQPQNRGGFSDILHHT